MVNLRHRIWFVRLSAGGRAVFSKVLVRSLNAQEVIAVGIEIVKRRKGVLSRVWVFAAYLESKANEMRSDSSIRFWPCVTIRMTWANLIKMNLTLPKKFNTDRREKEMKSVKQLLCSWGLDVNNNCPPTWIAYHLQNFYNWTIVQMFCHMVLHQKFATSTDW